MEKKHLWHQKGMVTLIFEVFLSFERLKTYFQTSAREISTILAKRRQRAEACARTQSALHKLSNFKAKYSLFIWFSLKVDS